MRITRTESSQAALYRVTSKSTKEVFYLVRSDSSEAWYEVRFCNARLTWNCTCPATKPCKHERAVQEVLAARRARLAEKIGGDMPAVMAHAEKLAASRAEAAAVETEPTYRIEQAQASITAAQATLAAERAARRVRNDAAAKRERAPLNGNKGFQLMR